MKTLLTALFRAIARVAASESGELLSVRRKAHLLEAERYARLAAPVAPPRPRPSARVLRFTARCPGVLRRPLPGKLAG